MTEINQEVEVVPTNPLPITYYTIFTALEELFPDQVYVIFSAIKRIFVIKKDIPGFTTMGINKFGHLFIAQSFWDKHMTDMNALKTVLLHELLHHISGDVFNIKTKEDGKDFELKNHADLLAMDSRINSFICAYRPDIEPQVFLEKFYNDKLCKEDFLHKILKPGSSFDSNEEITLESEYNNFYNSDDLCSHTQMSKIVFDILKKRPGGKGKKVIIKLIGMHGSGGSEVTEQDLEGAEVIEIDMTDLTAEQRKEFEKNIKDQMAKQVDDGSGDEGMEALSKAVTEALGKDSAQGCGRGRKLASIAIDRCLNITEKFDLAKFKKLAFDSIFHNVRSQARVREGKYTTVPYVPNKIFTSDIIRLAAGVPPLMFKTHKLTYRIDKNLLPIYLDVSGSTMSHLPEIVRLIANVSGELDYVWGFSDYIHKHTIKDLQEGKIKSSGGTSFDCIINHVIENKFQHFVVLTDGDGYHEHTGRIPGVDSVVTILFGYSNKNNFFSKEYGNTHMIDEVKI